jgi:hypothetical protein
MRWFLQSARRLLLAGLVVGASALSTASLRAQQQRPGLLPPPETVLAPYVRDSAVPGQPAPPMPDAEGVVPAPPTPDGAKDGDGAKGDGKEGKPFWALYPPVEKFPRPGWFPILPSGPGYYSLLDVLQDNYRKAPPKYPYPRFLVIPFSFFYADWRYLDDPKNEEHDYLDFLKRIHIGDDFIFTTGGELRLRYNNEVDSRLTGTNNVYYTERTRVYGDLWYRDNFRLFVETIDARSWDQDLPPLVIDQDHLDFLNLFADAKVAKIHDDPVYVRVGRQELLYGSQRFISPLDFANTRRTFQGVKAFWHSECLDVDAFCVQPVIPNTEHWDSVDNNQVFSGLYTTYRPKKNQALDLYYLNLDNTNQVRQLGIQRAPTNVSTFGARYFGDYDSRWLWEAEGDVQTGSIGRQSLLADALAVGGGYCFKDCPTKPQLWLYYEYASGDKNPAVGERKTFNQLFPFGHYYFGGTDQIGRQNIQDLNAQFVFYPTNWITCLVQYHILRLDSPQDALYNSAGNAIRRDPTGRAGTDVGEVLNLVVNFHLDNHQDILIQNAHLYSGDFIKQTGPGRDLNALYIQYCYRW